MNTADFNEKVETTISAIEDALDDCDADLDWDMVGGVLTIECENGSQVIINRQDLPSKSGSRHAPAAITLITTVSAIVGRKVSWSYLSCSIKRSASNPAKK